MKLSRSLISLLATAGVLGLVVSCGGGESDNSGDGDGAETTGAPAIEVSAEAMTEATDFFAKTCTPCHGTAGLGDGPAAIALDPKPAKYSDKAWQDGITNEEIADTIMNGKKNEDGAPSVMVGYSAMLEGKAEVVDGLVMLIRGFGE